MAAAARVRDRAGVQQVESSVECHNLGGPAQPDAQGLPGGAYRVAAMAVCLLLSACAPFGGPAGRDATDASAGLPSFYGTHFERSPSVEDLTRLGRRLFADTSLSASGALACASCHDPARAYGPPGKAAVMQGGADMASPGVRAVPSLTYQQATPPFTEHFTETEGDDSIDQGPARMGRPRIVRPRPGRIPAALAVRDGERQPRSGDRAPAAVSQCATLPRDIRRSCSG
jgi:hypothetical protein